MEEEIDKIKKRIKKQFEGTVEIDSSDIPIHERYAGEETLQELRKKRKKIID